MPNLPPVTIPADAAEKAAEKAKDKDFYADLTDEEREEEGLPPREEKKPAAAEAEKPETEKAEPEKAEPEKPGPGDETEEEEVDEEFEQKLFEEIAGIREDIAASLGKPEPAPEKKNEPDPLLAAALEHEDEVVRGLAERLQNTQKQLEAIQNEAREQRKVRIDTEVADEFAAFKQGYLIDGRQVTDAHLDQIDDFAEKNPDAGRSLTIEQLARVVFPTATKRQRAAPAKGPASPNGDGSAVATIVDQGSGSGGTTKEQFKPRPNETIESAIQAAGQRFGWKRGG